MTAKAILLNSEESHLKKLCNTTVKSPDESFDMATQINRRNLCLENIPMKSQLFLFIPPFATPSYPLIPRTFPPRRQAG
jgi:hypothetical protein